MTGQAMDQYLVASEFIDWDHPQVLAKAKELAIGLDSSEAIARRCFEFVRDEIRHSWDYQCNPVTCRASEALEFGTGYCYAKSHLLAALLRANGIPAGLCYQRLTIANDVPPFSLHGFNAVFIRDFGWYRMDARGNKEGVDAQFTPPHEKLAFPILVEGEADLNGIFAEPLPVIVKVLTTSATFQDVADNLPDIALVE